MTTRSGARKTLQTKRTHGPADHAAELARTPVFRAKRQVNRAHRRLERVLLVPAAVHADAEAVERAEIRLLGRRPRSWRVRPDLGLGEFGERRHR